MSNLFISVPELYLKSDVLSTDSSAILRSIQWYTGSDGVAVNLAASDFGTTGFGVFEPRTSRQEFFTWTTSTITSATTTGITIASRGLPWGSDYSTQANSRKFTHPAGSKVLLYTNAPAFYDTFPNKANAETITGVYTFTSTAKAKYDTHPTFSADAEIIDKKYADDLAIAGSPNASTTTKGIIEIATGAETAAGTGTGGTGALLVPANSQFTNTSAGAGDANKVPVLNASGVLADGFLDAARTWGTVQSFTANNCQVTTDADSSNDAIRRLYIYKGLFGDGSDGALSASSGATTLNTASKYVYQYTSVSLTGTASLTVGANLVTHPVFILVQDDLTITSSGTSVDMSGKGVAASTGVAAQTSGNAGDFGTTAMKATAATGGVYSGTTSGPGGGGGAGMGNAGVGGGNGSGGGGAVGGSGGAKESYDAGMTLSRFVDMTHMGGSGGSGAGGTNGGGTGGTGGAGGAGGGCIIFLVGGNINITTGTLTAAGAAGTNGGNGSGGGYGGGGGGGGGGGFIGVFYRGTATADSATYTAAGGAGGTGGSGTGTGGNGGAGGDGQAVRKQIARLFLV